MKRCRRGACDAPLAKALDDAMIVLYQNGEPLMQGNGLRHGAMNTSLHRTPSESFSWFSCWFILPSRQSHLAELDDDGSASEPEHGCIDRKKG